MNVNSPQQQLHAESFAADVLNQSCILFMDRVHDSVYGKRVFIAEFLKPDIRLRGCEITIGVFMQPVFHLNGKAPRYIGINGVEGVKYSVRGDDAEIRFAGKSPHRRFYPQDIFCSIRFTGNKVR